MKAKVNFEKIAKGLGAERRGAVAARGGFFGAMALAADIRERFQAPGSGGRATDPTWTERRLLPLAPDTLHRLEDLSARLGERGITVSPLQVAALLLERVIRESDLADVAALAGEYSA